jgi:hypothetical protein
MESTNGQVRLMPNTNATRNGLPERVNYVYRGTGEDIMPWAITGDGSVDYESGGEVRRSERSPRATWGRCGDCGYGRRSIGHRAQCG